MKKVENHWIKQNYLYIYAVITSAVSSLVQTVQRVLVHSEHYLPACN